MTTPSNSAAAGAVHRGALVYRARHGDTAAQQELDRNDQQSRAADESAAAAAAAAHAADLAAASAGDPAAVDQMRTRIAERYGIGDDARALLSGGTEEVLVAQARRLRQLSGLPELPAFADNPGQRAGAGPQPEGGSVERGRELYRDNPPRRY